MRHKREIIIPMYVMINKANATSRGGGRGLRSYSNIFIAVDI